MPSEECALPARVAGFAWAAGSALPAPTDLGACWPEDLSLLVAPDDARSPR